MFLSQIDSNITYISFLRRIHRPTLMLNEIHEKMERIIINTQSEEEPVAPEKHKPEPCSL
jgi:hypothetical protein